MKEDIIAIINRLGPVFPSEITRELKTNSLILSAYLTELIKEGRLKYSHKKIGNSPLYFLPGQEDKLRKRLYPDLKIPERKIVDFFEKNKLVLRENLSPQQRFMIDELRDFITPITLKINGRDMVFYKHHSISSQDIYNELKKKRSVEHKEEKRREQLKLFTISNRTIEKVENKNETIKRNESIEKENKKITYDNEFDFLKKYNLLLEKVELVKKNKEINMIAKKEDSIGQRYFVKWINKKSLNESDVGRAFSESFSKKMPCIIITNAKITKGAKKTIENIGSFINIVKD